LEFPQSLNSKLVYKNKLLIGIPPLYPEYLFLQFFIAVFVGIPVCLSLLNFFPNELTGGYPDQKFIFLDTFKIE
jgi:uncharacterized membrane protein